MKKTFYALSVLIAICFTQVKAQNFNIQIRDSLAYSGHTSNIGGIAINGAEYALVGWADGLSIVDVTNPDSIYEVINVPGLNSQWREVKTFNNYAYVTTEAGNGLQIINLSYLPDSAPYTAYTGDGTIAGQLSTIHALHIDGGYVYLFGSNLFGGAAVICDLNADPLNPVYKGHTTGDYIHDGYVRNDTLWAGQVYIGLLAIFDVTDKTNPVLLNTQLTPGAFTHNTWLNDEGTTIFTTDEVTNSYLTAYDITDINNITELDRFQTAPGSGAIVHNTHTLNNYEVVSWYTEGVVIVDASKPNNLVEVAKYDCSPFSGNGFNGVWGVYPYLPSGNLVVSDIEGGLYVMTPTYQRACFIEGLVTDSITGLPINGAQVQVVATNINEITNVTGNYSGGLATAGLYDITASAFGYVSKTITGVSLTNGNTTTLNIQLDPGATFTLTGNVISAGTGAAIPNAKVHLTSGTFSIDTVADASGNFSVPNFIPANYDITAQQWGYHTACLTNFNLQSGITPTVICTEGIYDDFVFDWGWTVTGNAATGMFVREEPLGTSIQGITVNPDQDDQTDCGDHCFVTGNTGTTVFDDAVTDGYTQLESPVFDPTNMLNPRVSYKRWFFNYADPQSGLTANDTLTISLNNGTQTVVLESVHPGNTFGFWTAKTFKMSNYLPVTNTMKLIFRTANQPGSQDILEVAIDKFQLINGLAGIDNVTSQAFQIYPNPANNILSVTTDKPMVRLQVFDVTARLVLQKTALNAEETIDLSSVEPGTYMVTVTFKDGTTSQQKLIKQ